MKVVGIVLLLLLALLAAALVHALSLKAPVPQPRPACSRNEQELKEMGERFGRLIRIETISCRDEAPDLAAFDRLQKEIDTLFPQCTNQLEKTVIQGALIYHWKGSSTSALPLLLMGHQDVVPAEPEGWTHPPFAGMIADGKLWGRGTLDDKCNIFCQMQAIENLLAEGFVPPCDVYLEYAVNEEISGHSAERAADWFRSRGIRFAAVWDEGGAVIDRAMAGMDRPYAVIGICEKGYADLKITARGSGGHSSAPKASTPVTRLADFMHDVNSHALYKREFTPAVTAMFANMAPSFSFGMRLLLGNLWLFRPLLTVLLPKVSPQAGALLGTTCCFTMMKGSDASNVIPSEASVICNLRPGFTQGTEESIRILKKYADRYGLEMEVLSSREPSPTTPTDTPVFQYLERCVAERYPDCGCSPYVMLGGTDSRHFSGLSENILKFYPIRITSKQMGSMHNVDECINLDSCSDAVDFYQAFLKNYPCAGQQS